MKKKKRKHNRKYYPGRDYHHIIPRCKGGDNSDSNLLFIKRTRHIALHNMFEYSNLRMIYLIIKETNHRLIMADEKNLSNWLTVFKDKTKEEALALLERVIRAKENQKAPSS